MSDDAAEPAAPTTITDRLRAAGISEERIAMHLEREGVVLDGDIVTDPEHPAPRPAKWWLVAS